MAGARHASLSTMRDSAAWHYAEKDADFRSSAYSECMNALMSISVSTRITYRKYSCSHVPFHNIRNCRYRLLRCPILLHKER